MLNGILNNNAINTAFLSVRNCYEYYESFDNAAEVSERFIQTAGILPENNFIGLQINAYKDGKELFPAYSMKKGGFFLSMRLIPS